MRTVLLVAWSLVLVACGGAPATAPPGAAIPVAQESSVSSSLDAGTGGANMLLLEHARLTCGGPKMTVHFYDVAQALAALVDLPNGKHILLDTGDDAARTGCGEPCQTAHQHLMAKLQSDLGVLQSISSGSRTSIRTTSEASSMSSIPSRWETT